MQFGTLKNSVGKSGKAKEDEMTFASIGQVFLIFRRLGESIADFVQLRHTAEAVMFTVALVIVAYVLRKEQMDLELK